MRYWLFLSLGSLVILLSSCNPQNLFKSKQAVTIPDSLLSPYSDGFEHVVKTDDKLTVSIWNHDDISVGSTFNIYNSNEVYGKWVLVDKRGEVNLPVLGRMKVAGKTTREIADTLTGLYAKQIVNPVVVVKVLNRQVTILGEVIHPASHNLEKEKYGLMEMIGRSGGFDTYADKKHVTIVRQVGKESKKIEIDMTQLAEYEAHNYAIEANDIIYVPARRSKMVDKRATTLIPFAGLITALVVAISFFNK